MIARVLTSRRTGAIRSPAPITHPVRDTAFHGLPSHMATCTEHDNIHRKSPTNACGRVGAGEPRAACSAPRGDRLAAYTAPTVA